MIFLLFNSNHQVLFTWSESALAFLHGARMDFSVVCYLLIIHALILFFLPWKPVAYLYKNINFYHRLLILVLTILLSANVLVFHFWGNLLNYRALSYLADPVQVLHSLSTLQMFAVLASLVAMVLFSWYVYRKTVALPVYHPGKYSFLSRSVTLILVSLVLVFGIRGGWQMLPMNESLVAYSSNNFLNQAALNPAWHLMNDVKIAGLTESNPFNKMENSVADGIVKELMSVDEDSMEQVLSNTQPNIVLIILESHTADVIGSLGGEKKVSPNLDTLIGDGLLFSSVISSGARTDQGIVSVLNGWPATPYHSIMRSLEKSARLPSLPKDLKAKGYHTSFYYGGESNFSNLNVYLIGQGFDAIHEKKDFPDSIPHGKWGIYDELIFQHQREDLNKSAQPFFSVLMTLSNHEPFDVPEPTRFPGNSEADRFRNAAAYTDACIGKYMQDVRKEPWYPNTLFIFVADHGHRLPFYRDEVFPNTKHIPLLFYGDVLLPQFKGKRVSKMGGHHDLPATLLPQMHMDASAYTWSKNLLSSGTKSFAYYQIEYVMGWIEGKDYFVYSYPRNDLLVDSIYTKSQHDALVQRGQAFIQKLYGEYLDY